MKTHLKSKPTRPLWQFAFIASVICILLCPNRAVATLESSTFLGAGSSSDDEGVFGIAIGLSNKVYVVGWVESAVGFPTVPGCYQTSYGGGTYDAFVSRFDPDLATLEASTYLGGAGKDVAKAIAIDEQGNVYVAGYTASTNFPVMAGAFTNALNAESTDAFICKLDANLTNLLASTFIGGSHVDGANAIVLTPSNVWVSGESWYQSGFPTTSEAFSATNAGDMDAFVCCFDTNLSSLVASSLIGGHYDEYCTSMAVDRDGNVFIAGHSGSAPVLYPPTFPTTDGAYESVWQPGGTLSQGFVCKFAPDASLLASTLIGGYYEEEIHGLALDEDGSAYVTGFTGSDDFPTTPTAFSATRQGYKEAVVSKFDNSLSNLLASTYLGGASGDDKAYAIAASPIGVAVTGYSYTYSGDFPTTPGAYQPDLAGYYDVFISRLSHDLSRLNASTYIGSSKYETGYALAFGHEAMPSLYVAGYSNYRFPTTSGAYDPSYGNSSGYEGVVCRFDALFARIDDADFDGMPDWWETMHIGSATGLIASVDIDLDGMTTLAEFIAGTDPTTNASVFRMAPTVTAEGDGISVEFESVDGRLYSIEATDNLAGNEWNAREVEIPGTGDAKVIIDAATAPSRYYRSKVSLPGY